jgi:hypothetical protein
VEHTPIFKNTDSRLKQLAVDATVFMKQKRKVWNESISPDIDSKVKQEMGKHVPDLLERLRLLEEKLQERGRPTFPLRRTLPRTIFASGTTGTEGNTGQGPTGQGPTGQGPTGPSGHTAAPNFNQSFDSIDDLVVEVR